MSAYWVGFITGFLCFPLGVGLYYFVEGAKKYR